MLTIKSVLDQFSQAELYPATDASQPTMRTYDFQCPLQLATRRRAGYTTLARIRGLADFEVTAIMAWADYGIWPIHLFGPNPTRKEIA